jgi:hypothetical protein
MKHPNKPLRLLTLMFICLVVMGATTSPMSIPTLVWYYGKLVPIEELEAKGPTYCHDARGDRVLTCFDSSAEGDLDLIRRGKMPPDRSAQFEATGHTHR